MKTQRPLETMTTEQRFLLTQAMGEMERHYDADARMLGDASGKHSTRESAHYALGLLVRGNPGDLERACDVLGRVIEMQLDAPDEIYHGTFRTSPEAAPPPAGHMAWKTFGPGFAYSIDDTMDRVFESFLERIAASNELTVRFDAHDAALARRYFREASHDVLPPVWESYDPNWREFIACTFAVIVAHFEASLPAALVRRMDDAARKAVEGSLERRRSQSIPMNTNIELMHFFIAHYYGFRFGNDEWIEHADREAQLLLEAYREFDSFAEFNSSTYYGVDVTVLGLWRVYGRSASFQHIGRSLERGLWRNIAMFYNPNLENLSGPFARAYEMDMRAHSSIGVFVYLALGQGYEHLAGVNCETSHDPMIALVGVDVPEEVLSCLREHQGDRLAEKRFRELCERDPIGANTNLCTATAWIERNRMLGAMSGSRNTNGQMHPATMHWQTDEGCRYTMRLLRRAKGASWNTHLRGVAFEAAAAQDRLDIEVAFDTAEEIELFFEFEGEGITSEMLGDERWRLPGVTIDVEAEAPAPDVRRSGEHRWEIVYACLPQADAPSRMRFSLRLE
ncbi:hypothetical protein MO973_18315 [Paenibacillus sp. TRM 82003]|nr:hypothetical protein [Paenibacillus sp. TRM 82003]